MNGNEIVARDAIPEPIRHVVASGSDGFVMTDAALYVYRGEELRHCVALPGVPLCAPFHDEASGRLYLLAGAGMFRIRVRDAARGAQSFTRVDMPDVPPSVRGFAVSGTRAVLVTHSLIFTYDMKRSTLERKYCDGFVVLSTRAAGTQLYCATAGDEIVVLDVPGGTVSRMHCRVRRFYSRIGEWLGNWAVEGSWDVFTGPGGASRFFFYDHEFNVVRSWDGGGERYRSVCRDAPGRVERLQALPGRVPSCALITPDRVEVIGLSGGYLRIAGVHRAENVHLLFDRDTALFEGGAVARLGGRATGGTPPSRERFHVGFDHHARRAVLLSDRRRVVVPFRERGAVVSSPVPAPEGAALLFTGGVSAWFFNGEITLLHHDRGAAVPVVRHPGAVRQGGLTRRGLWYFRDYFITVYEGGELVSFIQGNIITLSDRVTLNDRLLVGARGPAVSWQVISPKTCFALGKSKYHGDDFNTPPSRIVVKGVGGTYICDFIVRGIDFPLRANHCAAWGGNRAQLFRVAKNGSSLRPCPRVSVAIPEVVTGAAIAESPEGARLFLATSSALWHFLCDRKARLVERIPLPGIGPVMAP